MTQQVEPAWCRTTPRTVLPTEENPEVLRSVGTALDVLECFAVDAELGVSDIARRLGIAKSTAHRLLQTLGSRGLTEQDPATGKYRLGLHLYELGRLAQARNQLRHSARPVMEQLAHSTGLTVNLSVPDGPDVVFVERLEQVSLEHLGHSGMRLPAHCTSSGKAMAAFNAEFDEARRQAGFPPRSSRTVRTERDWIRELELAQHDGFAVSQSESFNGVSTIAVPIINMRRTAFAALSLLGPTEEVEPQIGRLSALLRAECRRVGRGVQNA